MHSIPRTPAFRGRHMGPVTGHEFEFSCSRGESQRELAGLEDRGRSGYRFSSELYRLPVISRCGRVIEEAPLRWIGSPRREQVVFACCSWSPIRVRRMDDLKHPCLPVSEASSRLLNKRQRSAELSATAAAAAAADAFVHVGVPNAHTRSRSAQYFGLPLAAVIYYTHYSFMIYGHARIPITSWLRDNATELLARRSKRRVK